MQMYIIIYKDAYGDVWSMCCTEDEFADTMAFLQENDCEIVEVIESE